MDEVNGTSKHIFPHRHSYCSNELLYLSLGTIYKAARPVFSMFLHVLPDLQKGSKALGFYKSFAQDLRRMGTGLSSCSVKQSKSKYQNNVESGMERNLNKLNLTNKHIRVT